MGRISSLICAVVCVASTSGCGGLGWYRAAGHIPGVAPTDYAFYNFCDVSSQLYPAAPSQIESSAIEALGDLGFRVEEPPQHLPEGETKIFCKTPDGRPTKITITPQNCAHQREGRDRPGSCRRRRAFTGLFTANLPEFRYAHASLYSD